jgi:hypothetical protein
MKFSQMKKALLTIALGSGFVATALFAQGPGNPPDPTKFVARRVQHLTTLLDLLPGQVQTATTAFTTAATANAALETQLRTARQTLRTDVEGGTGNIATDAATIGNLEGQILANDATAEKTFWASLNGTQQDKLKSLGHEGFGGGPGPGGPGGPRGFGHP